MTAFPSLQGPNRRSVWDQAGGRPSEGPGPARLSGRSDAARPPPLRVPSSRPQPRLSPSP